ncbi:MAG: hypothetical protein M0036_15625 [Desulfobacteraceae bacterium]|nr:hypothetical protein [Desulfobacteraceae bacterium]
MNKLFLATCVLFLILSACASVTDKGRMEDLDEIIRSFDYAMMRADWRRAADFIDPSKRQADINFDQYKKIKVVDCKTARMIVSEDKLSAKREVDLQYFLVDRNILRAMQYKQAWKYNETAKGWIMESGLPVFE